MLAKITLFIGTFASVAQLLRTKSTSCCGLQTYSFKFYWRNHKYFGYEQLETYSVQIPLSVR